MNILVTGGAGFIGSSLCDALLARGYRVICLDNFHTFYAAAIKLNNIRQALEHPQYTLIEGDIRDDACLGHLFTRYSPQVVIHLAALAGVRNSLEDPLEYLDVDIKGTVQLLEYARKYQVEKFIFASSSSVYGKNATPFCEEDACDSPLSPYATSKRAGELLCSTYHSLYGLSTICLRFFTVYGPRQRPEMAIHRFTRLIDQGDEVTVYGDGSSSRDYTYIDDIIEGILSALQLSCGFEIFNLGNSHATHLNEVIHLIERCMGKAACKVHLPMQPGDAEHTFADLKKSSRLLGFIPRVGIEEGIERFAHWYKCQK